MSSSLPLFDLLHTPVPRQSQQTLLSRLAIMAIDHVPCIPPARVRLMESQNLCGHGRLASSCQFSSDWWAQSAYKPAQTSICNQLRTFNWPTVCKYCARLVSWRAHPHRLPAPRKPDIHQSWLLRWPLPSVSSSRWYWPSMRRTL